jgi:hypothetical protein
VIFVGDLLCTFVVPVFASGVIADGFSSLPFWGVPMVAAKVNFFFVGDGVPLTIVIVVSCVAVAIAVAANANFVCQMPFDSVSFSFASLACRAFSPRRGRDCFLLLPGVLRRFLGFTIVGCSRSFGTFGT